MAGGQVQGRLAVLSPRMRFAGLSGARHRTGFNRSIGLTLVELVIVIAISGIISVITPVLMWHGVKALVFLPRALAVNHVAAEVAHQIIEGGFSTIPGEPIVRGIRFAAPRSSTEPAIWLAEDNRIGFFTSDAERVVMWLDSGTIMRGLVPSVSCTPAPVDDESIPSDAQGLTVAAAPLFRYYDRSDTLIPVPGGCTPSAAIRRVEVVFTAQTGSGNFDQGDAREQVLSSVAIRDP